MAQTTVDELKKLAQKETIVFGSNEVLRKLKRGQIKKIFLASNVPADIEEDIRHNAGIAKVEIEVVGMPNDEFGMVFKRVHPVLTMGIAK
ncbi:ribosomal L7Ae/L30e/S12e/Gadd45 family protein [Candidatus Woesearchaeota archaeon]|nr:ribosomal L7Ae/L30e/S12e/Gadd45 family protein [Candidatus Woesearchaeota archaeon]